jgi:hypothetical protein
MAAAGEHEREQEGKEDARDAKCKQQFHAVQVPGAEEGEVQVHRRGEEHRRHRDRRTPAEKERQETGGTESEGGVEERRAQGNASSISR